MGIGKSLAKVAIAGAALLAGFGPANSDGGRNWSGMYVGGHAGISWADAKATGTLLPLGGFFTPASPNNAFSFNTSGFIGGLQAGIQHQSGRWVYGAEVSYSWADLEKGIVSPYFPATDTEKISIGSIVMLTGRLGYAVDQWMVYAKAGYAGADVEFRAFDSFNNVGYRQDGWHNGYVIGAGLEYAISQRITLGLEYNFIDLGHRDNRGGRATSGQPESYRLEADMHAVTARLNFYFGHDRHAHEPMK